MNFDEGGAGLSSYSVTLHYVPEPSTALLLGLGMVGISVTGRSKRQARKASA